MSKYHPAMRDMLQKKEVDEGKDTKLEKGDFFALLVAGLSVFGPIILGGLAVLALVIWVLTTIFH